MNEIVRTALEIQKRTLVLYFDYIEYMLDYIDKKYKGTENAELADVIIESVTALKQVPENMSNVQSSKNFIQDIGSEIMSSIQVALKKIMIGRPVVSDVRKLDDSIQKVVGDVNILGKNLGGQKVLKRDKNIKSYLITVKRTGKEVLEASDCTMSLVGAKKEKQKEETIEKK